MSEQDKRIVFKVSYSINLAGDCIINLSTIIKRLKEEGYGVKKLDTAEEKEK